MTTLAGIEGRLAPQGLAILGGFVATAEDDLPTGTRTVLMIGPDGANFWPILTASAEWQDGAPDPVDRWSRRVIGGIACGLGAKALFPFGGPPYRPFFSWALRTGRCHQSPVRLLVHDEAGLWVSFRGALALKESIDLPPPPPPPCEACIGRPCLTTCPPRALTAAGYDVPACHAFLDTPAGQDCLSNGCAVRCAFPVPVAHARLRAQSAYHMGQFHR